MNIEEEIFKKRVILFDKLIPYGFTKEGDNYLISKTILNSSFRLDVKITKRGKVEGHIIDLNFNEEYFNYRIKTQTGEYVGKVREEFTDFLNDIKEHCTSGNDFVSPQTNRLAKLILEEFNDAPEFPWENDDSGIFRNPTTKKWYALIMHVDRSRFSNEQGPVEILNIKLDENEIQDLLLKDGYYKAYHMNKTKWITITLDDTLSDEVIMEHIKESHTYSNKK